MNVNPASPRSLWRLALCLCGVVLLGCVMSPLLYWAGTWLAEVGILPIVEGFPFHRYFSRSMQISALLMLWPAFRWVGIRSVAQIGIQPNPVWRRDVLAGFVIAFVPLLALSAGYLWMQVSEFRAEWKWVGFARIAATAAVVSGIEEFLFRGVFLGLCLRAMGPWRAVVVSSAVFTVVHFLRGSRDPLDGPVTWASGFGQLPLLFAGAPEWPVLGWGAVSLFGAGLLLGYVAFRTKSLFLAGGLHAGWIFGQQGLQLISKYQGKAPDFLFPWVGPNVVSGAVPTGVVPLAVLGVTAFIVLFYAARARGRQGN